MKHILAALGRPNTIGQNVLLVLFFVVPICCFLSLGYIIANTLHIHAGIIHLAGWLFWFVWQGIFFPRNREQYLASYGELAYKHAFYKDIILGVSFGVSQMVRPFFNGFIDGFPLLNHLSYLIIGAALMLAGISLLFAGFTIIGFDGAGFLYEYFPKKHTLIEKNIYSFIRHPLFLGGVIASIGASLFYGDNQAILLAGINIVILPIYTKIEDQRLIRVLGKDYADYCASVGGIIPKVNGFESPMNKTPVE